MTERDEALERARDAWYKLAPTSPPTGTPVEIWNKRPVISDRVAFPILRAYARAEVARELRAAAEMVDREVDIVGADEAIQILRARADEIEAGK